MMLSATKTGLLRRLLAGPIVRGGIQDPIRARNDLVKRGWVLVEEDRVRITDAGRALFGQAFTSLKAHLDRIAPVHRPAVDEAGTLRLTRIDDYGNEERITLRWRPGNGTLEAFTDETSFWSLSDLVSETQLSRNLRRIGIYIAKKAF